MKRLVNMITGVSLSNSLIDTEGRLNIKTITTLSNKEIFYVSEITDEEDTYNLLNKVFIVDGDYAYCISEDLQLYIKFNNELNTPIINTNTELTIPTMGVDGDE